VRSFGGWTRGESEAVEGFTLGMPFSSARSARKLDGRRRLRPYRRVPRGSERHKCHAGSGARPAPGAAPRPLAAQALPVAWATRPHGRPTPDHRAGATARSCSRPREASAARSRTAGAPAERTCGPSRMPRQSRRLAAAPDGAVPTSCTTCTTQTCIACTRSTRAVCRAFARKARAAPHDHRLSHQSNRRLQRGHSLLSIVAHTEASSQQVPSTTESEAP
jgi:hypothetical protein